MGVFLIFQVFNVLAKMDVAGRQRIMYYIINIFGLDLKYQCFCSKYVHTFVFIRELVS